jgi:hypothetical protein|tara:strand:+ start:1425 stop:1610 length:186 start_codon:yes stop_codon:yes gene_type:complete
MKRITKHTKQLVWHILNEGMGKEYPSLLEIANHEWECETNRPYTREDYYDACEWICKKVGI